MSAAPSVSDRRAVANGGGDSAARRGCRARGLERGLLSLADRTPAGLVLAGGSTLPEARGRGCYRALVRARWDEAVRLGTPGLAVQAQYGTSAPILRKLGFIEVASIHTLQSGTAEWPG
jgi:GNAT superfamily N-acetyltransferase